MQVTKPQGFSTLKQLGLSEDEVMVYHALLGESETVSIRRLATITKLNRGSVYEALKALAEHGLVSFHRKGARKQYFPEKPDRVYELIENRKRQLEVLEKRAQSLVPRLFALSKRIDGQPLVRFYEYEDGMAAILHDVLGTVSQLKSKEYYAISHQNMRPYLYKNFPNYTKERIKRGIFVKVIRIGSGKGEHELAERRWLEDSDLSYSRSYMLIYGNKVAVISVSADDTPYGVVIEEADAAYMHRLLFTHIWNSLPPEK